MSRFRMHYKGKPYRLLGRVRHSETLEMLTLYECLYTNDLGNLWVRPEGMFHESVVVHGQSMPRFREIPITIHSDSFVRSEWRSELDIIIRDIFDGMAVEDVEKRLEGKLNSLVQVAFLENDMVGFKIGFADSETLFVSWLGGVRPYRRGVGVGGELLKHQHQWAMERGYLRIQTKTYSRWTEMIRLDLRAGFQIIGVELKSRGLAILLEKKLC